MDNRALHVVIPGICPPAPRPRFGIMPIRKLPEIAAMIRRGCGMRELMGCFRPAPFPPNDDAYRAWKRAASIAMDRARLLHFGRQPFAPQGTALEVHLLFVMPLPVSERRIKNPPPRSWCVSKRRGDADNLAKGPLDAANGVLWHDDSAVASIEVEIVVGAQEEAARTEMIVLRLAASDAIRTRFEDLRGVLRQSGRLLDAIDDRRKGGGECKDETIPLQF